MQLDVSNLLIIPQESFWEFCIHLFGINKSFNCIFLKNFHYFRIFTSPFPVDLIFNQLPTIGLQWNLMIEIFSLLFECIFRFYKKLSPVSHIYRTPKFFHLIFIQLSTMKLAVCDLLISPRVCFSEFFNVSKNVRNCFIATVLRVYDAWNFEKIHSVLHSKDLPE